jgi:hypothetical protein
LSTGHDLPPKLEDRRRAACGNREPINWNPMVHIPPGVYDLPHFDVHFYLEPIENGFAMGYYPTASCVRYDAARDPYNVSMEQVRTPGAQRPRAAGAAGPTNADIHKSLILRSAP